MRCKKVRNPHHPKLQQFLDMDVLTFVLTLSESDLRYYEDFVPISGKFSVEYLDQVVDLIFYIFVIQGPSLAEQGIVSPFHLMWRNEIHQLRSYPSTER